MSLRLLILDTYYTLHNPPQWSTSSLEPPKPIIIHHYNIQNEYENDWINHPCHIWRRQNFKLNSKDLTTSKYTKTQIRWPSSAFKMAINIFFVSFSVNLYWLVLIYLPFYVVDLHLLLNLNLFQLPYWCFTEFSCEKKHTHWGAIPKLGLLLAVAVFCMELKMLTLRFWFISKLETWGTTGA